MRLSDSVIRVAGPAACAGFLFFRVGPVNERDIADALDKAGFAAAAKLGYYSVPRIPITDPHSNLDQFVVIERRFQFPEQAIRQAGVAHDDEGAEIVAEAT